MGLSLAFEAIGTKWQIASDVGLSRAQQAELDRSIKQRIAAFDKVYSRFRDDSLVSKMSRRAGTYRLPPDSGPLLHFYEQLYGATGGKVTPLIGQLMADAGYDAQYSLKEGKPQTPPEWQAVMHYADRTLTLTQPVLLDFGAAGKGYLVDIVGKLLEDAGVTSFLINAGGDILHTTNRDETVVVGLENQLNIAEVIGVARLSNQSICGSAGNRRKWGQYMHIIDPQSLTSPAHIIATWVVAPTALVADGIATALFFTEPARLHRQFEFEYGVLYADMAFEQSPDFPVQLHKDTHENNR